MLGTAFQSAVAMGLHLRNSANEVQFLSKEIRYRVWWALFVMDSSLQAITGRPPKTDIHFCTTPLPMPYREEDLANNAGASEATAHVGQDRDEVTARAGRSGREHAWRPLATPRRVLNTPRIREQILNSAQASMLVHGRYQQRTATSTMLYCGRA